MRHCRSGIAASIYSGIAASIYSGIAASMHSHSGIAASMQLQRALTAALPPACVHSGSAASMLYILRHCRQKAFTPLNLNSCCHFCSSASIWASILGVWQSLVTSVSDHACLAEQTSCQERSDRL
jgi:hypothetical protein